MKISSILIVSLITGLTACGGSDNNNTQTSSSSSAKSSLAVSSAMSSSKSSISSKASSASTASQIASSSSKMSAMSSATSSTTSSSSAASSTSSPAAFGLNGIYDVDYAFFRGVYTFLDNGEFYGMHFVSTSTLAGHPHGHLSDTNSTTKKDHIAWANFVDAANGFGFQEPNGMFGRTLNPTFLSVSITGLSAAPTTVFSANVSAQKTYSNTDTRTLYNNPVSFTDMAGSYTGIMRTVGINMPMQNVTDFSITNTGSFSVTSVNCTFTGTLVQHGSTGVYETQVATSGASCTLANPMKGILLPLSVTNSGMQLALQLDDLNNVQSAVFIINK